MLVLEKRGFFDAGQTFSFVKNLTTMTSPFPGMDPYLEGYVWPDVHQALAEAIKELLLRQINPKYVARTNLYTVKDSAMKEDVGIMYPDVEVLKRAETYAPRRFEPDTDVAVLSPATVVLPFFPPVEVKIPFIEITDRQSNVLVTAIEILSPVNKRKPGLEPYRKKRKELHKAGVHLLEIDLLRRWERPIEHPFLPKSDYLVALSRAQTTKTEIWAFHLRDPMPTIPVPLRAPDPDVLLNLRKALDMVYERSMYELSVNYSENPPPPALSEADRLWMRKLLDNW